jgi:hypothetical protein
VTLNSVSTTKAHIAITNPTTSTIDLALISSSYYNDPVMWHERMEHVNFAAIQKMALKGSLINFCLPKLKNFQLQHPCEGYQYGKHAKSSYPLILKNSELKYLGVFFMVIYQERLPFFL